MGYRRQAEYAHRVPQLKYSPEDDAFRELLRELRISHGLTQTELANRLGVPQSYVSKFETGERRLDFVETSAVCDAIGMSIIEFATEYQSRVASVTGQAPRRKRHCNE